MTFPISSESNFKKNKCVLDIAGQGVLINGVAIPCVTDRQALAEFIPTADQDEKSSQVGGEVQSVGCLQEVCDSPREAGSLLQVGGESQCEVGCLRGAEDGDSKDDQVLKDCKAVLQEAGMTLVQSGERQSGRLREDREAPKEAGPLLQVKGGAPCEVGGQLQVNVCSFDEGDAPDDGKQGFKELGSRLNRPSSREPSEAKCVSTQGGNMDRNVGGLHVAESTRFILSSANLVGFHAGKTVAAPSGTTFTSPMKNYKYRKKASI